MQARARFLRTRRLAETLQGAGLIASLRPQPWAKITSHPFLPAAGWHAAFELLSDWVSRSGAPSVPQVQAAGEHAREEYILMGRHDIAIDVPIDRWPTDFSRLLFEQEGRDCCFQPTATTPPNSCGCNMGMISESGASPACHGLCSADHLLWMPHRHLSAITHLVLNQFQHGHYLIRAVERSFRHRHRLDEIGFMFPGDCASNGRPFTSCDERRSYRPLRPEFMYDAHGNVARRPGQRHRRRTEAVELTDTVLASPTPSESSRMSSWWD